jgi:Leucine-rich repeat (LRR) protein
MKYLIVFSTCFTCLLFISISAQSSTDINSFFENYVIKNRVNAELTTGNKISTVVVFNDSNLEQAVRDALSKPTGDILDTDMATLTSFVAQKDSIFDLTGLEYAINLRDLFLDDNLIVDLTPLESLDTLDYLGLYRNNISNISSLQYLTNLSWINLSINQINDITALQYLTNLQNLALSNNPIDNFSSLENLINLKVLHLNLLGISDISMIQNLTNLESLYLESNLISDISYLQNLNNLKLLFISSNSISDISPLQNITSLDNLKLSYNQIYDISPLQYLPNLVQLLLGVNEVEDITAVQNLTSLKYLNFRGNNVSDITPVQNLIELIILGISENQITDISVIQNLTSLEKLTISNNPISDINVVLELTNLTSLWCSGIELKDITPIQNLTALESLGLDDNQLDNEDLLMLYSLDNLTYLKLSKNSGIVSGTAVQALADSLEILACDDINWEGTCGVDPNKAVICWCEPSDSADVEEVITVQATATDTNQSHVKMKIDWGDGNNSDYSEIKANATTFEFSHIYTADGYYEIRVKAMNEFGAEGEWSETNTITIGDPVVDAETNLKQHIFNLSQNYPNPFNPSTTIKFGLPKESEVSLAIYNILGQRVTQLVNQQLKAGYHEAVFNNSNYSSGIYFYRLQAGDFVETKKMILLK